MKRRQFITLIGGAAAAWPLTALAQARKTALIAWLTGSPLSSTTNARVFLQALQDLGYVAGRDLQITYRSSDGYQDRLPALAEELVRLNPDVIVAAGLDAVVAVRNVTQTIPIVSATLADAIRLGLIANEARPTGNVTGLEPYVAGLPAKQMRSHARSRRVQARLACSLTFQIQRRLFSDAAPDPSLAQSGHPDTLNQCPLSGVKRTFS